MTQRKSWMIIALILFSIFTFLIQRQNLLKPEFIDEQDNFIVAQNLINGNKIYTNIFSHHQPGTYILSAAIQKLTNPNLMEVLIKRHRQFIILWSILWAVFIVYRFGPKLLGSMMALELIKNIYLGSLFLAESLVMAPMIYLVISFLENKYTKLEILFWGLITAIVGVTLAPMWPLLTFMIVINCWRWRTKIRNIMLMFFSAFAVLLITIIFIDIKGYFENAILINQKYYISIAGGDNLIISTIKATITPFLYIKDGLNVPETTSIKFFILMFFIAIFSLIKTRKWKTVLLIWLVLTLSNLRNFELQKIFYDGFHILIWVGLIISITLYLLKKRWWLLGFLPIIFLLFYSSQIMFSQTNYVKDFDIYYSRIFNMSEAIRTTKNDNDRLITIPGKLLGYWQAKIKPAGRFIFFYKWMNSVEKLRNEQLSILQSKPEYLIIEGGEGLNLSELLENYKNFKYRGSESSEFYIRSDIYNNFSKEKIMSLKYYGLEAI